MSVSIFSSQEDATSRSKDRMHRWLEENRSRTENRRMSNNGDGLKGLLRRMVSPEPIRRWRPKSMQASNGSTSKLAQSSPMRPLERKGSTKPSPSRRSDAIIRKTSMNLQSKPSSAKKNVSKPRGKRPSTSYVTPSSPLGDDQQRPQPRRTTSMTSQQDCTSPGSSTSIYIPPLTRTTTAQLLSSSAVRNLCNRDIPLAPFPLRKAPAPPPSSRNALPHELPSPTPAGYPGPSRQKELELRISVPGSVEPGSFHSNLDVMGIVSKNDSRAWESPLSTPIETPAGSGFRSQSSRGSGESRPKPIVRESSEDDPPVGSSGDGEGEMGFQDFLKIPFPDRLGDSLAVRREFNGSNGTRRELELENDNIGEPIEETADSSQPQFLRERRTSEKTLMDARRKIVYTLQASAVSQEGIIGRLLQDDVGNTSTALKSVNRDNSQDRGEASSLKRFPLLSGLDHPHHQVTDSPSASRPATPAPIINEEEEDIPIVDIQPSIFRRRSSNGKILIPKRPTSSSGSILSRSQSATISIQEGSMLAFPPRINLERTQSEGIPPSPTRPIPARLHSLTDMPRSESSMSWHRGSRSSTRESSVQVLEIGDGERKVRYQLGNGIGKGQFGAVYRSLNLSTGEMVAIKRIKLIGMEDRQIKEVMREVDLLQKLRHPNIVRYEGMSWDEEYLNIVLEYVENGSLGQTLKSFGKLNERLVASYISKILDGLQYLHAQGIVHCDLKAANILSTKNGNIKLSDFGVSLNMRAMKTIKQNLEAAKKSGMRISEVNGTPNWMAPEVISLEGATTASDIWSLGCTIIELLTGRPPYSEYSNCMSVLFRIVEDDMPPLPDCSAELEDFLNQCFIKTPELRPSAKDLTGHIWLSAHERTCTSGYQDSTPLHRRISATESYLRRPLSPLDAIASFQPTQIPDPAIGRASLSAILDSHSNSIVEALSPTKHNPVSSIKSAVSPMPSSHGGRRPSTATGYPTSYDISCNSLMPHPMPMNRRHSCEGRRILDNKAIAKAVDIKSNGRISEQDEKSGCTIQ